MIELTRLVIAAYKPCVIMVTHDEMDAAAMQASILRLHDGRLIRETD